MGCGGLGCTVLLDLCRLGIKKVITIDRDVVDAHNLNRQILFGLNDVGKSKVHCAAENVKLHNIKTGV